MLQIPGLMWGLIGTMVPATKKKNKEEEEEEGEKGFAKYDRDHKPRVKDKRTVRPVMQLGRKFLIGTRLMVKNCPAKRRRPQRS